jgi:hypothetical protein
MIRSTIFIFLPVRYDSCNEYYRIKKFPWKSLMHEAIPFLNKFITRYIHGRPLLCCMDLHAMKACNDQSKALVVSQFIIFWFKYVQNGTRGTTQPLIHLLAWLAVSSFLIWSGSSPASRKLGPL